MPALEWRRCPKKQKRILSEEEGVGDYWRCMIWAGKRIVQWKTPLITRNAGAHSSAQKSVVIRADTMNYYCMRTQTCSFRVKQRKEVRFHDIHCTFIELVHEQVDLAMVASIRKSSTWNVGTGGWKCRKKASRIHLTYKRNRRFWWKSTLFSSFSMMFVD